MRKFLLFAFLLVFISMPLRSQIINMSFGGIDFRVMDAKVIGNQLRVYLDLYNYQANEIARFHVDGSSAFDPDSVEYKAKMAFFDGKKGGSPTSIIQTKMKKNAVTKAVVIFEDGASKLDSLSAVTVKVHLTERERPTKLSVRLVKIPVKQQDLSDPYQPFEIDDGLFMKIKSIESNQEKIIVEYLVTAREGDQKANLKCTHRVIDMEGNEYRSMHCSLGKKNVYKNANLFGKFVEAIPLKGSIEFETKGQNVEEIALLELNFLGNSFHLKGIPLK